MLRLSKKSTALQEMPTFLAVRGTYVPTNESSEPCLKGINPFRHSHYTLGENAISACGLKSATPVASYVVVNFKFLIKFKLFDKPDIQPIDVCCP